MKYFVASKLSENIHKTPEGYLLCIGVSIARTGDMEYAESETPLEGDNNGRVIVHRDESEVFRPETIASFEGKPVTITHPIEFVSPQNWKQLACGIMQNVRRGEGEQADDLISDLLITDSIAIGLIENGLRELSCGYEAEYIQTGEGKGKQTKIIGNHLALVDQGRAGAAYAIKDHKAKGANDMKKKSVKEQIKSLFAKAQDEAMNLVSDDESEKEKEAKDAEEKEKADKAKDAPAYDELIKAVKDLSSQVAAMGKSKDDKAKDDDEKEVEKEKESKDDAEGGALEERLKVLEAAVKKLLEHEAKEGEEHEEFTTDDDDDDDEEGEESEDDKMPGSMVGDTKSRAEILAPGLKATKDIKAAALKVAYATKDGKAIIDSLSGGKPVFTDAAKVETLFIAASELLKVKRTDSFSKTKQTRDADVSTKTNAKSAEDINAINAEFYKRK